VGANAESGEGLPVLGFRNAGGAGFYPPPADRLGWKAIKSLGGKAAPLELSSSTHGNRFYNPGCAGFLSSNQFEGIAGDQEGSFCVV
jgi:hypothetical protein